MDWQNAGKQINNEQTKHKIYKYINIVCSISKEDGTYNPKCIGETNKHPNNNNKTIKTKQANTKHKQHPQNNNNQHNKQTKHNKQHENNNKPTNTTNKHTQQNKKTHM